jgi:hypothetical protein
MAKLRLLERGLLDAAQGIDDIILRVRRKQEKEKKGKSKKGDDEEEDQDEEDANEPEVPDETPQEFMTRINVYVAIHFHRASSSKRDNYKDGLVYQTRKDIINDFLKSCILKKCQNGDCGSYVPVGASLCVSPRTQYSPVMGIRIERKAILRS